MPAPRIVRARAHAPYRVVGQLKASRKALVVDAHAARLGRLERAVLRVLLRLAVERKAHRLELQQLLNKALVRVDVRTR